MLARTYSDNAMLALLRWYASHYTSIRRKSAISVTVFAFTAVLAFKFFTAQVSVPLLDGAACCMPAGHISAVQFSASTVLAGHSCNH